MRGQSLRRHCTASLGVRVTCCPRPPPTLLDQGLSHSTRCLPSQLGAEVRRPDPLSNCTWHWVLCEPQPSAARSHLISCPHPQAWHWVLREPQPSAAHSHLISCPHPQASTVTVHFYGLVHWEDPMDESLASMPCHCSPPEGTITKEGMLHYKAGTSYLGKEHWKTCFVVLR